MQGRQDIGPELLAERWRMTGTVGIILEPVRDNDHYLLRRDPELLCLVFQGGPCIPIVKPVFAVIIVQREQASDPDHRVPFYQPKLLGEVTIGVRHYKRIELLDVREHLHRWHPRSEEHTSELQSPCNLVCRL